MVRDARWGCSVDKNAPDSFEDTRRGKARLTSAAKWDINHTPSLLALRGKTAPKINRNIWKSQKLSLENMH